MKLSGLQRDILKVLITSPNLSQQRIAEMLDTHQSSISRSLRKLEKVHFIHRDEKHQYTLHPYFPIAEDWGETDILIDSITHSELEMLIHDNEKTSLIHNINDEIDDFFKKISQELKTIIPILVERILKEKTDDTLRKK